MNMSTDTSHEKDQKPEPKPDGLNRREALWAGTALLGTAGLASTAQATVAQAQTTAPPQSVALAQPASQRPNILFFHVDNTGVGDWGAYGGAYALGAKTPNVDRFANESLLLQNYAPEA